MIAIEGSHRKFQSFTRIFHTKHHLGSFFIFKLQNSMASKYSDSDDMLQHNQRVSDFDAKSCEYLLPIQGYEKRPLVSLEEAIEPIVPYVPRVKQMAHVAKHKCKKPPADGLTVDESASIMLYSMDWEPQEECLYHVLNGTLRSENRKKLLPWFSYLKLILTALDLLPSKHPIVYRGIKRDMGKDYPDGSTAIWWGFSSCTSNIGVLKNEQFLGSSGTRTFFTIECTSGKDIRQHSYFAEEEEILLPPGREFQVVGCLNQPGGLHMIQLKEVQPLYPHLEPVSKVRQSCAIFKIIESSLIVSRVTNVYLQRFHRILHQTGSVAFL